MQNVRPENLKTAIFTTLDEFRNLVYELCGENSDVDYDYDGISFGDEDGNSEPVIEKLCEHYGVKEITSIHADDCDMVGIWIIYKE